MFLKGPQGGTEPAQGGTEPGSPGFVTQSPRPRPFLARLQVNVCGLSHGDVRGLCSRDLQVLECSRGGVAWRLVCSTEAVWEQVPQNKKYQGDQGVFPNSVSTACLSLVGLCHHRMPTLPFNQRGLAYKFVGPTHSRHVFFKIF